MTWITEVKAKEGDFPPPPAINETAWVDHEVDHFSMLLSWILNMENILLCPINSSNKTQFIYTLPTSG